MLVPTSLDSLFLLIHTLEVSDPSQPGVWGVHCSGQSCQCPTHSLAHPVLTCGPDGQDLLEADSILTQAAASLHSSARRGTLGEL